MSISPPNGTTPRRRRRLIKPPAYRHVPVRRILAFSIVFLVGLQILSTFSQSSDKQEENANNAKLRSTLSSFTPFNPRMQHRTQFQAMFGSIETKKRLMELTIETIEKKLGSSFNRKKGYDALTIRTKDNGSNSKSLQTNPHTSWCPHVTCIPSSPKSNCQPCRQRFLIEIALRRSGSTSLMEMLNALPGVRMAGENNNQLYAMYEMMEQFNIGAVHRNPRNETEAEMQVQQELEIEEDVVRTFACPLHSMIESINPPSRAELIKPYENTNMNNDEDSSSNTKTKNNDGDKDVILGFKTVRFLEKFPSDLAAVQFINAYFPCSRIVLNYSSNITKMMNSPLWRSRNTDAHALADMNQRMHDLVTLFGTDRAILMEIGEWAKNTSKVDEMIHWLGFDKKTCSFERTFHYNEGGGLKRDKEAEEDSGHFVGADCTYAGS